MLITGVFEGVFDAHFLRQNVCCRADICTVLHILKHFPDERQGPRVFAMIGPRWRLPSAEAPSEPGLGNGR